MFYLLLYTVFFFSLPKPVSNDWYPVVFYLGTWKHQTNPNFAPFVLFLSLLIVLASNRYKILAASSIKDDSMSPEKASQIILETINLDAEQYRLGKTKVLAKKTVTKIGQKLGFAA